MHFSIIRSISIVLIALVTHSHCAITTLIPQPKSPTVLLIHMFKQPDKQSPELQANFIASRVRSAFKAAGSDVTIHIVSTDTAIEHPVERLKYLFKRINSLVLNTPDIEITHLIFAGPSGSKNSDLLIGDLIFSKDTIDFMVSLFETLRIFLAPNVKLFLFGPSTFKGSDEEITAKAHWFQRILQVKNLEIFGYNQEIYQDTANLFWTFDFSDWLSVYFLMIFSIGCHQAIYERAFFTRQFWLAGVQLMTALPLVALASHILNKLYDKHLKYTELITALRQLYYFNSMGSLVTLSPVPQRGKISHMLCQDYFRRHYVQPDPNYPIIENQSDEYQLMALTVGASILVMLVYYAIKKAMERNQQNGLVVGATTIIPPTGNTQTLEIAQEYLTESQNKLCNAAIAFFDACMSSSAQSNDEVLSLFNQGIADFLNIFNEQKNILLELADDIELETTLRHNIIQVLVQTCNALLHKAFIGPLTQYYQNQPRYFPADWTVAA